MTEVKQGGTTPRFLTQSTTTVEIRLTKSVDFFNTGAVREIKYELC